MQTRPGFGALFVAFSALFVAAVIGIAWAQEAPALTDLERTKVELLQVRTAYAQLVAQYDGCKAEVGAVYGALGSLRASAASAELTAQEQTLKTAIEREHDGFTWSAKAGLTKKPPEKKDAPQ